jgi:hypothetical protein
MKAYDYIIEKQTQWAWNRGIPLISGKVSRGRLAYTCELNLNLFEPLDLDVRQSFKEGAKTKSAEIQLKCKQRIRHPH